MSILPDSTQVVPTTIDTRQLALSAILAIINSINKPIKNEERWGLTKGATNNTPKSLHDDILEALAEAYSRNRDKHISDYQARADIEAAYRSQGDQSPDRFFRLAAAHGATVTPEHRSAIKAITGGNTAPVSHKKLSPAEKVARSLDEIVYYTEAGWAFMRRKPDFSYLAGWVTEPSKNDYCIKKNITVIHGDAFCTGDGLIIVPMHGAFDPIRVTGWQTIYRDKKLFEAGQPTKGQFAVIGEVVDAEVVLVCEGWATGQALYKATGLPVACALSLNNMIHVAVGLLHCEGEILARSVLICADTGHDAQMQELVNGLRWNGYEAKWCRPLSDSSNYDFWDMSNEDGAEAVKNIVAAALERFSSDPEQPKTSGKTFINSLPDLMLNNAAAKALVKRLITEKSLSSLTGPTMSGKSFVAVGLAWCIAQGLDFHGRKTRQANVLYIAGEGNYGLKARFKALQVREGLAEMPANLFVTSGPINLLDDTECQAMAAFIIENDIELVIVDTLARSFSADENSAKDMGYAISNLTKYFIGNGAAVLLVHHTGHGDQSRARGSSVFRASLDMEIGVEALEGGLKLKCWKAKDFEPWPDEYYNFESIDTGLIEEDGDSVTSLILSRGDTPAPKAVVLTKAQEKIVWTLKGLIQPFNFELALSGVESLLSKDIHKRQTLRRLLDRLIKSGELIESYEFFSFI